MMCIYIYYILYGGVIKRGSLERLPFTSMIFPAIPRFLLIFFVDFPPATFDDTGGLVYISFMIIYGYQPGWFQSPPNKYFMIFP